MVENHHMGVSGRGRSFYPHQKVSPSCRGAYVFSLVCGGRLHFLRKWCSIFPLFYKVSWSVSALWLLGPAGELAQTINS
ncbi:uncharacterized protein CIMG_13726 [Coccidioides immitis RS]|uniref:Uncharacterized protein n=1 Tax=Coccidioides immitis (strain RS) TaxID=246410 RepID=A0A0D8JZ40_COCIM|nr:uncharacterized protein CIMG_13726 [Coccidioides immitis RS]KJF61533.1 hypothetical protein CIMG_13726 [Coccidioides immitis RS]